MFLELTEIAVGDCFIRVSLKLYSYNELENSFTYKKVG